MIPHGAIQPAELETLGIDPATVIDFSSNVNPYGPSPRVTEAIQAAVAQGHALTRYPDPDCLELRRQISQIHNLPIDQILIGNGSVELLWLLALTFLDATQKALVVGPTFGEYAHTAQLTRATVEHLTAVESGYFQLDSATVDKQLSRESARIVYFCNPNNPTGTFLPAQPVIDWATRNPDTLFLIDEAYIDFTPQAQSVICTDLPNLLVLRSLTKAHSLAGLRLGYLVGPVEVLEKLRALCPPWSVNGIAQVAGVAAVQDQDFLTNSLAQLRLDCESFHGSLIELGLTAMPTATSYFLVKVENGKSVRLRLLQEGLMVRDCTSFGLPEFIRIATRRPEENERLQEALEKLFNDGLT